MAKQADGFGSSADSQYGDVRAEVLTEGTPAPVAAASPSEVRPNAKDSHASKLTNDLVALAQAARSLGADTPITSSVAGVTVEAGYVTIDAKSSNGDGEALLAALKALGLVGGSAFEGMASGRLPVSSLDALNDLDILHSAAPAYMMRSNSGAVINQAGQSMGTDVASSTFNVTGQGVDVGVLSDSFDTSSDPIDYAADIASGDLPAGINILDDSYTADSIDEGRAMAQLIHDIAPDAGLLFHTAFNGAADFASGILELAAAGAEIIVDDIGYLTQPFFQDGVIARAVDQVFAQGVAYFSSAGNDARQSYEAAFSGVSDTALDAVVGLSNLGWHDFDTGAGVDTLQAFTLEDGESVRISFQWDEPYFDSATGSPGSASDLDFWVLDETGTSIVASGFNDNIGGDPVEFITFTNTTGSAATFNIAISLYDGPAPNLIKYIDFDGGTSDAEYFTFSGTSFGHPSAEGGQGVGAAFWGSTPAFGVNPPELEIFSSAGGTPILFEDDGTRLASPEVRNRVDFTAPDGGNTTFFGNDIGFDADSDPNFFGTSAAAPNAAALAALMLEANPSATPTEIYTALQDSAIDITEREFAGPIGVGFDDDSGAGLIQAVPALNAIIALNRTQVLSEGFETDGNSTRYTTSAPEYSDGDGDFFTRTDGTNIGSSYDVTGFGGSFYFAAMDLNGDGEAAQQTLSFTDLDISGLWDLLLSIDIAEDDDGSSEDWDRSDFFLIEYQIDGGGFQNLFAIENDGSTFNSAPSVDTDFDGNGDGIEITDVFQTFLASIDGTGSSLDLRLTFALEAGDEDLAIDNIIVSGEAAPTGPSAGDIIITEIMQNPSAVSDNSGEYFEVYNTTGSDIDLNGWTISDNDGDSHTISGSVIVPASGYAVLGINGDTVSNGGVTVDYVYTGITLANGADEIILTAPGAIEIDRVEYDGGSDFPDPTGASMELDPNFLNATDNDNGANWTEAIQAFGDGDLGTPGAANGAGATRDIQINELRVNQTGADEDEFIELFSTDPSTSLNGLWLIGIAGEDDGAGVGDVTFAFNLSAGSFDADGFFLLSDSTLDTGTTDTGDILTTLDLSGLPQTFMLVDSFTGTVGDDLDTDDDGTLNTTPWSSRLDDLSFIDDDATADVNYSSVVIGPDGSFTPAGAAADPDGSDNYDQLDFSDLSADTPGATNTPPPPAAITLIHDIQGNASNQVSNPHGSADNNDGSPLDGQIVTIRAIVVGDFQNGDADNTRNLNGFYVQEEDGDADGDATTSEGLFVFDSGFGVDVNVGDLVEVTGTVDEFFGETQLDTITNVTVISQDNPLPTAAVIDLPSAGTSTAQNGDLQADLEAYEGMLVTFSDTLTIAEMFQLDRFNEITLTEGGRPQQFTQTHLPDVAGYAAHLEDVASRSIVYDDGQNVQNADIGNLDGFAGFNDANAPNMGDTITGLTGVLSYSWAGNGASSGTYRVRSTEDGTNTFTDTNTRETAPADVGGDLKVASLNVLNFFTTIDDNPGSFNGPSNTGPGGTEEPRGAEDLSVDGYDRLDEYDRQLEKLVTSIVAMDADVLGLVEIENDPNGSDSLQALVDAINAVVGAGTYDFVDAGPILNVEGGPTTGDAIKNAFIYKTGTVGLNGSHQLLDASDDARFDSENQRPALAQSFIDLASGDSFTAVVNHFKSKGSVLPGEDDIGDGQANNNPTRTKAAEALVDWLATDPTGTGDTNFLILGDLNAYAMEDPIMAILEGADGTVGTGDDFTDLIQYFVGATASSYVFDGQTGTLDYALANAAFLASITGATNWTINSDEADALDYNLNFGRDPNIFDGTSPYRSSDHDPIIVGLAFDANVEVFSDTTATTRDSRFAALTDAIGAAVAGNLIQVNDAVAIGDVGDVSVSVDALTIAGDAPFDGDFTLDAGLSSLSLAGANNGGLIGNSGDNTLTGSDGDNHLTGAAGNDILRGNAGDDVIDGDDGNDTVFGSNGFDTINGGRGDDVLNGGPGGDVISGGDGDDQLIGGQGRDILRGDAGDDIIDGDDGNDTVFGSNGFDTINGGRGDDVLNGGPGGDVISGGDGDDQLIGGQGRDILRGDDGDDVLTGGLGDDVLDGGAGADTFDLRGGDTGNDTIVGFDTSDTVSLTGFEYDFLDDARADFVQVGSNVVFNGNGTGATAEFVNVSLADVQAAVVVPELVITGTSARDEVDGTTRSDIIRGMGGSDSIEDRLGGDDVLDGGDGNDWVGVWRQNAASFSDVDLIGGDGDDTLRASWFSAFGLSVDMDGGDGNDTFHVFYFQSSFVSSNNVTINAGTGDDSVYLTHNSTITITLGTGSDRVAFNNSSGDSGFSGTIETVTITDFETGASGDVIDLEAMLADRLSNWNGVDNPFSTGHLRLIQSGADTLLQIDHDGGSNSWNDLVQFQNTNVADFTHENFDGNAKIVTPETFSVALTGQEAPASFDFATLRGRDAGEGLDWLDASVSDMIAPEIVTDWIAGPVETRQIDDAPRNQLDDWIDVLQAEYEFMV